MVEIREFLIKCLIKITSFFTKGSFDDILSNQYSSQTFRFDEEKAQEYATQKLSYNKEEFISFKKIDKSLIALYNVYVLGTILYDSFVNYEAINRITRYFYAFWIFPFALILFYRKSFYKESSLQLAYIISFGVFIHFFRYLFLKGDQTLFLWDI